METDNTQDSKNQQVDIPSDFAKQLHEQYSINDNAKASHVIGFITAIAFIFTGFGYVYAQPYLSNDFTPSPAYSQLLLSVDILANVMLLLLAILCVNFGYSTRRDHVVITRIRQLYAMGETDKWFNGQYDGCNKNEFNYLPDYYIIMFVFIQIFIALLALGCSFNIANSDVPRCNWWIIALFPFFFSIMCWCCHYCKYLGILTDKEKKNRL